MVPFVANSVSIKMEILVHVAKDNVGWVEATTFLPHNKEIQGSSLGPASHDTSNDKAPKHSVKGCSRGEGQVIG